jgi:hypothetical protein
VFPYWREFERAPPVRIHTLGMFEYIPYGISQQKSVSRSPAGGTHWVVLRQFKQRPVTVFTDRQADGRCRARAQVTILGKAADLAYIFVQLGRGGLTPHVDYVDVFGRDPTTGNDVQERLRP